MNHHSLGAALQKNAVLAPLLLVVLLGCNDFHLRSRGVTIQTVNDSGQTVRAIEIDFPGGSYGISALPPGGSRARWVKPAETGALKLSFQDSAGAHQATSVILRPGDAGSVTLHLLPGGLIHAEDQLARK